MTAAAAGAIPPGAVVGILGGGQLGRMTAMAAARLGYRCHVYAPEAEVPAADVAAAWTRAGYGDGAALDRFAAAELEAVDDMSFAADLQISEQHFTSLSESLGDRGIEGSAIVAWERVARSTPASRVLH